MNISNKDKDFKIINRLFHKEELYYNKRIHSTLMSKLLSVLIDRNAEDLLAQDEYLIQANINDFISGKLRNTEFSSCREWRYIDNAVIHTESGKPMVIYEVKSFIKPHENSINEAAILKDILKLAIKKNEFPNIESYMLIAGKSEVPRNALNNNQLNLPNKFIDTRERTPLTLSIDFFKTKNVERRILDLAVKAKIKKVTISPSRWKNYDGMCAITWKINKE